MRKLFLMFACFFFAAQARAGATLRVLSYESFLSPQGLAPVIRSRFQEECKRLSVGDCDVEFVKVGELTGLLGKLRGDKRTRVQKKYQIVLGLDQFGHAAALSESLIEPGQIFDESAFAIIVDREKLPEKNWPKSWKEVPSKLAGSLLIQDPRTSTLAIAWLRVINEFKLLKKDQATRVVKRVFPSWTSSYSAFLRGEGAAVWSYQTSEAYHRCNEKSDAEKSRYVALPLAEGYPVQREFVARVKSDGAPKSHELSVLENLFFQIILNDEVVQEKIFLTQWMFPANKKIKAPPCFSAMTKIKILESEKNIEPTHVRRWMDEWTL